MRLCSCSLPCQGWVWQGLGAAAGHSHAACRAACPAAVFKEDACPHCGDCVKFLLCCRYEFKFLLEHRSGNLEWENGTNRTFTVPKTAAEMLVEGDWGSTQVGAGTGL